MPISCWLLFSFNYTVSIVLNVQREVASRDVLEIRSYRYDSETSGEDEDPDDMGEEVEDCSQTCHEVGLWRACGLSQYARNGWDYKAELRVGTHGRTFNGNSLYHQAAISKQARHILENRKCPGK